MNPQQKPQNNTLEITNFTGNLTRVNNGDINSGLAKFSTSFGYDPFTKPGQLTWGEQPIDQDPTGSVVSGLMVAGKTNSSVQSGVGLLYTIDHLGNLYQITPNNSLNNANLTATSVISGSGGALLSGYTYGGGMEFWGQSQQIYVGGDNGVEKMNFDGSSRSVVGTTSTSSVVANVPRPLQQFAGNLYFGNGTNIGQIGASSIVSNYAQLNPSLPPGMNIRDLELSADINYLIILSSYVSAGQITQVLGDRNISASGDSYIFQWNGSDVGITAGVRFPSFAGTGLHSFLSKQLYTSIDSFGSNVIDGATKKVTLPNVKPPSANAVGANGNMFTFITVEKFNATLQASLFYYGQLDDETQNGLWRLFSIKSIQTNGWIESVPWQIIYSGNQPTTDNASSVLATLEGKHIFSALDVSNGGGTSKYKLYVFALPNTGTGTPNLGVYETQNQLFRQKVTVKQIRVYTNPTVSGNGFKIDFIGGDGNVVTNGTFTYAYAAGTDTTQVQGSLERIDFNPNMKDIYSLGLRITNTGTTNMTINKVEIDYQQSGK